MESLLAILTESPVLGALVAQKPISYVVRLGLAVAAFGAAMSADKVVARVLGLVWLLVTGGVLLLIGIQKGTVIDIILGLGAIGAAGYSWWFTRC